MGEKVAFGDAGDQGVEKRPENLGAAVKWEVAMRPGERRASPQTAIARRKDRIEHLKASIRAEAAHPFRIVRNLLGLEKVRYEGLAKNTAQLFALSGLADPPIARRRWLALSIHAASRHG